MLKVHLKPAIRGSRARLPHESDAVMGGRAVSMSPLVNVMGLQLELSQDYE
jgi:hypothetical protein